MASSTIFVVGVLALSLTGALLPLDLGGGHKEFVVLTIVATAQLGLLGPPGLLIVWLAVAVGTAAAWLSGRPFRSLLMTGTAITVGFGVACLVYLVVLGGRFPLTMDTPGDGLVALTVMSWAWLGTMSVRAAAGHLHVGRLSAVWQGPAARDQSERAEGFDPFDDPLMPYVLPTVGGVPIVAATVALYSGPSPAVALGVLAWTLPLYATCRLDLYQRRTGSRLREEAERRRVLAGIGAIASRVVHQTRHQAGLMGWSLHRLRRLMGDPSPEAIAEAHRELTSLSTAKQRIQQALDADIGTSGAQGQGEAQGQPAGLGTEPTVGTLVTGVVDQLERKAAARGVPVKVVGGDSTPEDGPQAPGSLHAAVFNLVDNAVDAAASLVEVRIDVPQPDAGADVQEFRITVTDDGPGLPDDMATALQPLVTSKPQGTGMGLPIAEAVVTELGGTLRYQRDADRTCFTLSVPITNQPAPEDPSGEG